MRKWAICGTVILCFLIFTACGGSQTIQEQAQGQVQTGESEKQSEVKPPEPITLQLLDGQLSDEMFEDLIVKPLAAKYPYITIERTKGSSLSKPIEAGEPVDLYINWAGPLASDIELKAFADITPLLKKHQFDLGRLDPQALETTRKVSAAGSKEQVLYGLPYLVGLNALYYNKDLFDQFGVSYPKDGMTWDTAIDLGKKMARSVNGVSYIGLDIDAYARMTFPYSLGVVDVSSNKSIVDTEPYHYTLGTLKKLLNAQGIMSVSDPSVYVYGKSTDTFVKDKRSAMLGAAEGVFRNLLSGTDFDWDVAQYPSYPERMNTRGMYGMFYIIPLKQSKHLDDDMKVIETLLSDDVQALMASKYLQASPLKDPKFRQQYGKGIAALQGKHLDSIFKSVPAEGIAYSKYYSKANAILTTKVKEYLDSTKDLNTALREADQEINKMIAAEETK
jgi:multiple sugar transport system substrate-binding protein